MGEKGSAYPVRDAYSGCDDTYVPASVLKWNIKGITAYYLSNMEDKNEKNLCTILSAALISVSAIPAFAAVVSDKT